MKSFLSELKMRNASLYYFGLLTFAGAIACILMIMVDNTLILGINAWIKPFKFFISTVALSWSMAWLLYYIKKQRAVKIYSCVLIITLAIELICITLQSVRGQRSHFNVNTGFDSLIFSIMGFAIMIFALWTIYITVLAFLQKEYPISKGYAWGIRLGLLLFILFANEGWVIVGNLGHTVGAADGNPGLALVNWSKQYGDLRIVHFFGMHSLQIIPLFSFYIGKTKGKVILFSVVYFLLLNYLFIRALKGLPLFF
jgi:hypothetical protein